MFESLKKAFARKGAAKASSQEATPVDTAASEVPSGPRIGDKYPQLTKMVVNLSIKAPFEKIEPTVRGFSLGPDAMANFVFRCKNTECIDGGFDLTEEIERMINAYETSSHGRRVCQGWDGKSNVGHQRCYYELNFLLKIDYS